MFQANKIMLWKIFTKEKKKLRYIKNGLKNTVNLNMKLKKN